jgi:hypothetical protein
MDKGVGKEMDPIMGGEVLNFHYPNMMKHFLLHKVLQRTMQEEQHVKLEERELMKWDIRLTGSPALTNLRIDQLCIR